MAAGKAALSDNTVKKLMYSAIPLMFVLGVLTHFLYKLSGENPVVGIFCPVNESVWEHLKMTFWVPLGWWVYTFYKKSKTTYISAPMWFFCCAAALYIAPLVVMALHYTYTGALGIHMLILDILTMILALTAAQAGAFHLYEHARINDNSLRNSLIVILILAAAFVLFTFITPQLPIFMDPETGLYGIR